MNFLFLKEIIVACMKLIPRFILSDKEKPHLITLYKVVNLVDSHLRYTYIIPCSAEIDADVVIDIFESRIKQTVGLPLPIVFERDQLST